MSRKQLLPWTFSREQIEIMNLKRLFRATVHLLTAINSLQNYTLCNHWLPGLQNLTCRDSLIETTKWAWRKSSRTQDWTCTKESIISMARTPTASNVKKSSKKLSSNGLSNHCWGLYTQILSITRPEWDFPLQVRLTGIYPSLKCLKAGLAKTNRAFNSSRPSITRIHRAKSKRPLSIVKRAVKMAIKNLWI